MDLIGQQKSSQHEVTAAAAAAYVPCVNNQACLPLHIIALDRSQPHGVVSVATSSFLVPFSLLA